MTPRRARPKAPLSRRAARRVEPRVLARGRLGRPSRKASAAINTAVIQTARDIFLTEGYSAASMEAVAKRSGVSKGTLYARFPTKEALFTAVVQARVAEWSRTAGRHDDALAAKSSLRERLEHHALIFLESCADPEVEAFGRLTLAEARRFPEISRIYHEIAYEFGISVLVQEIEAAAKRDGGPACDAREAALTLADSLSGWAAIKSTFNIRTSARERQRAARYRVAVFLEGRAAW